MASLLLLGAVLGYDLEEFESPFTFFLFSCSHFDFGSGIRREYSQEIQLFPFKILLES